MEWSPISADPSIDAPDEIATGPDGALWFTNSSGNSIGRITTDGVISHFTDPSIRNPVGIVAGPDGALWFTNSFGASIGRITTGGSVTSYSSNLISFPEEITVGPDGALWFANSLSDSIGRITTDGSITTTNPLVDVNQPFGITSGPDGAIWFTDPASNSIGRLPTSVTGDPFVTSVSPSSGLATPSSNVTITGSDFTGATMVTFGGVPASSFTVESDSMISAVTPFLPQRTLDIQVTNGFGESALTPDDRFTVESPASSPQAVTAVAGPATISVSWQPPSDTSLGPVLEYAVRLARQPALAQTIPSSACTGTPVVCEATFTVQVGTELWAAVAAVTSLGVSSTSISNSVVATPRIPTAAGPHQLRSSTYLVRPPGQTIAGGSPQFLLYLQALAPFSDPGQQLTYSAAPLPDGLQLDSSTGLISGSLAQAEDVTAQTHLDATTLEVTGSRVLRVLGWMLVPAVRFQHIQNQLSSLDGPSVQLVAIATDLNGASLAFSATGLPPGVSIDPSSGLMSGVPTQHGNFFVNVAATGLDGQSAGTSFHWRVT